MEVLEEGWVRSLQKRCRGKYVGECSSRAALSLTQGSQGSERMDLSAQPQDAPTGGWEKLMGCREVMTFPQGKDVKPILILLEVKMTENWNCGYSSVPPVCP